LQTRPGARFSIGSGPATWPSEIWQRRSRQANERSRPTSNSSKTAGLVARLPKANLRPVSLQPAEPAAIEGWIAPCRDLRDQRPDRLETPGDRTSAQLHRHDVSEPGIRLPEAIATGFDRSKGAATRLSQTV